MRDRAAQCLEYTQALQVTISPEKAGSGSNDLCQIRALASGWAGNDGAIIEPSI